MVANRPNGDCVLLVSPTHEYAEVLGKQGDKLTVLAMNGDTLVASLADYEKLGAKPVKAGRITKANGALVYIVSVEGGTGEFYMEGQYYPSVAITPDRRQWR